MALDPHPLHRENLAGASAERLKGALDQLAQKAKPVAAEEFDAAVDEVMNHIRPRRI